MPKLNKTRRYITSKTVFIISVIVALLTIAGIWLFGLGQHRTMFENSILSTSILSFAFFLFLVIGLYKGIKLKDDIGSFSDKLSPSKIPNIANVGQSADFILVGDGIEGVILGFFLWVIATILIAIFLWLFGAVLWTGIIGFIAMLYWIFFRALRLVFKNSSKCVGNFSLSLLYGITYTSLYNFWIYSIIFITHYFIYS